MSLVYIRSRPGILPLVLPLPLRRPPWANSDSDADERGSQAAEDEDEARASLEGRDSDSEEAEASKQSNFDGSETKVNNITTATTTATTSQAHTESILPRVPSPSTPVIDSDRVAADGQLKIRSKRTERQLKKQQKKQKAAPDDTDLHLLSLPNEVLFAILVHLRPSDVFRLARTCTFLSDYVSTWKTSLAKNIISRRYPCLEACFRLPVLLEDVDPATRPALQDPERQKLMGTHRKFTHLQQPDPNWLCTCLTCLLRWNSLCVVVDFAHWQSNLDEGMPIPMIPRGKTPAWNEELLARHTEKVKRALASPLWHARLLEEHLRSTTRSIRRNGANKGNRRRRFLMTAEDELSGTDEFLRRSGPPTVDFPFHRDNYYMLEAYLPNRGWTPEKMQWVYLPDLHERDLQWVVAQARQEENQGSVSSTWGMNGVINEPVQGGGV